MNTMGERIKYYREKMGLTQDELGDIIGVQKSAIVKYEKGRVVNIKQSSIRVMAELFGVSASYLAYGDDEQAEPAKTEVQMLFDGLSDENKQMIINLMKALQK